MNNWFEISSTEYKQYWVIVFYLEFTLAAHHSFIISDLLYLQ